MILNDQINTLFQFPALGKLGKNAIQTIELRIARESRDGIEQSANDDFLNSSFSASTKLGTDDWVPKFGTNLQMLTIPLSDCQAVKVSHAYYAHNPHSVLTLTLEPPNVYMRKH